MNAFRTGFGYDLHKLAKKRKLILGGVEIPFRLGEKAYSDGDVLIHAIIDSLLGACGNGDIGTHFPPGNPQYKDISSRILLKKTLSIVKNSGYRIVNIDCTVILQKPKLAPFIDSIKSNLKDDLELDPEYISVKAKTGEGIGPVGRSMAVKAYAVVLIEKI
jgi:2-C-methyl-D-erythritol 2,4-cyclodiphosphate synthase